MRKAGSTVAAFIISTSLSSCGLVGGAFKAGIFFAIVIIAIIGAIIWALNTIAGKVRKRYRLVTLPLDGKGQTGSVK